MRKLARVVQIDEILTIANADNLVLAKVGGWDCVVRKGTFAAGDLAVYIEIDSLLPKSDPRWESFCVRKTNVAAGPNGEAIVGHVVRTMRLRGQLSQGILMPTSIVPGATLQVGEDVADALGIIQYEPPPNPSCSGTRMRPAGAFPTHVVPKTDSERVQNLDPRWFAELNPQDWYATEKLDGTSLTVLRATAGDLVVCSRNWAVRDDEGSNYWKAARMIAEHIPNGYAVQAEIYGPTIQQNPLKVPEIRVAVFAVARAGRYLPRWEWPAGLLPYTVPLLHDMVLPTSVAEAIKQVDGIRSTVNPTELAEGVVWHRKSGETYPELNHRANFQIINNSWLLEA